MNLAKAGTPGRPVGILKWETGQGITLTLGYGSDLDVVFVYDDSDEIDKQLRHLQRQATATRKFQELKSQERLLTAELLALRLREIDSGAAVHDEATRRCELIMQQELANAVDLPVCTSSLLQVPVVLRTLRKGSAVGIVTADRRHLTAAHLRQAGITVVASPAEGSSFCEWKGMADYFDVVGGGRVAAAAAWGYPAPSPRFAALLDHVSVYPGLMDLCTVDGATVAPQEGGFYGGWVTADVVGPFKGSPGSWGW